MRQQSFRNDSKYAEGGLKKIIKVGNPDKEETPQTQQPRDFRCVVHCCSEGPAVTRRIWAKVCFPYLSPPVKVCNNAGKKKSHFIRIFLRILGGLANPNRSREGDMCPCQLSENMMGRGYGKQDDYVVNSCTIAIGERNGTSLDTKKIKIGYHSVLNDGKCSRVGHGQ